MKTRTPNQQDPATLEYWRERLGGVDSAPHNTGLVVRVSEFAVLAHMASANSPLPAIVHALAQSMTELATARGHDVMGIETQLVRELGRYAFPGGGIDQEEQTATVTPLFPNATAEQLTDVSAQPAAIDLRILSQGA